MTATCRQLHAFADAELGPAETAAFGAHLGGCDRCPRDLESIFVLKALAETAPLEHRKPIAVRAPKRRWMWALTGVSGIAAAAAAAVVVLSPSPDRGNWAVGPTRPLEARLTDPRGDIHRPFDPLRGDSSKTVEPDYRAVASLQRHGDLRGLASRWLLDRDTTQTRRIFDQAVGRADLDNERAVLALLERKPEAALHPLARALERDSAQPQPLWNRALAMRDLGLDLSAAQDFAAVEARAEPGWAPEAGSWSQRLRARANDRRSAWSEANRSITRLADEASRTGFQPPAPLLERWPELVRAAFYDALRGAPSPERVVLLAPLARELDQRFGSDALARQVTQAARLDFRVRAPLARRYRELLASNWKEPRPAFLASYAASLRRSGPPGRDLLLGVVLVHPGLAEDPGEPSRLASAAADPWLTAAALAAEAERPDRGTLGDRVRLLRRAIEVAAQAGGSLQRLELEERLASLLQEEDPGAAQTITRRTHRSAQALGVWPAELRALGRLERLASQRQDLELASAYRREAALLASP